MQGIYENIRDQRKLPECWQRTNDQCLPHFHSSIELTYVLRGGLRGVLNGKSHDLLPHQLLICPSYSLHCYETPESSASIVLTVPTDFVPSFQQLLRRQTFGRMLLTLSPKNELLHCLRQLMGCTMRPDPNTVLIKGYVYAVMGQLMQLAGLVPLESGQWPELSREVLLYLEERYREPLSILEVATHFGYSKSRFAHIFSQTFGCGFWEYINLLRCRHAAMLLLNENCTLIQAAMGAGYENMRTFYRNFKQVFGATPSQYLDNAQRKERL